MSEQTKTEQDLATDMTALAYRMVVANHMRSHAGLNKPDFDDCRQGFCGDWHSLQEKACLSIQPQIPQGQNQ